MLAGLSPLLQCRLKRMGWTIPLQRPPAAKREVPEAEPSRVTLTGQGRDTGSKAAFLWILPKSSSLQHLPPDLGIWHPPHRIFSWDAAALQRHQEVLLGSGIPTASFPQVILLESILPAATFPSKYTPGISAPHLAPSPVPAIRQQPLLAENRDGPSWPLCETSLGMFWVNLG